jgi:Ser/Thr protein kinase RdoA (MazF antagonist)
MKLQEQLQDWAIPTILKNNFNNSEFLSIVSELTIEFFPSVNNLPTQIIHRDAHPGNILLKDSQLIGFIDFDIARIGIRLFDLCYCSTSILMSGFSESNNRELWPSLLGELVRGYNFKNRLSSLELRSIIYVIFSIQVVFAAYFYDMDNNDVAQYNLQSLYWLYNNKLLIEAEIF